MLQSKLLISFNFKAVNDLSQSMGCSASPPLCPIISETPMRWFEGRERQDGNMDSFSLSLIPQSKTNSILKIHARTNSNSLNPLWIQPLKPMEFYKRPLVCLVTSIVTNSVTYKNKRKHVPSWKILITLLPIFRMGGFSY